MNVLLALALALSVQEAKPVQGRDEILKQDIENAVKKLGSTRYCVCWPPGGINGAISAAKVSRFPLLSAGSQNQPGWADEPAIPPIGSQVGRTSQCLPLAEAIEQGLLAGLSAQRIYQDLVLDHAFTGAYDAVKRFVRRLQNRRPVHSVAWNACALLLKIIEGSPFFYFSAQHNPTGLRWLECEPVP